MSLRLSVSLVGGHGVQDLPVQLLLGARAQVHLLAELLHSDARVVALVHLYLLRVVTIEFNFKCTNQMSLLPWRWLILDRAEWVVDIVLESLWGLLLSIVADTRLVMTISSVGAAAESVHAHASRILNGLLVPERVSVSVVTTVCLVVRHTIIVVHWVTILIRLP